MSTIINFKNTDSIKSSIDQIDLLDAQALAETLADPNAFSDIKHWEPAQGPRPLRAKELRHLNSISTFCKGATLLSKHLRNGERIDQNQYEQIQARLSKAFKRAHSPKTKALIQSAQTKLIEGQEESIKQCLDQPINPFEKREIQLAPSNPQKGILSTLFHTLNFLGSLSVPKKVAPQEAAATLAKQAAAAAAPLDKSTPKPSPFQLTAPQCVPLQTLEKELMLSLKGKYNLIAGPVGELTQYGNKHLNLVKMEKAASFLRLPNLEIPAPKGLKSSDVEAFLRKEAPEIFKSWGALKALQMKNGDAPFFFDLPQTKDHLAAIQTAIKKTFSSPKAFSLLNPEIESWLEKLEKDQIFLMVRSTGAEDSKQAANAGGNLSRAYVKPNRAAFMQAVGDVVQSYFGKNSLQNRLNAKGDLFAEPLQLSVTAQALIGEPIGGATNPQDIPVSLVAFTNEPLYIGDEEFRAMRISLTYGHGEGVVSQEGIATDSVLILQSQSHPDKLHFIYDNQLKNERLAPQEKGDRIVLEKKQNPDCLINKPALSRQQLALAYSSLVSMEAFFEGHPTDIEAVFWKGKFYFVQARPVNRKPLLPTYLRGTQGIVSTIQAQTIVPGKASVLTALSKDSVLVANTLKEAEEKFQSGRHQLVVVAQSEPQNSHPIVNFSNLGIPCLYSKDKQAIEKLLKEVSETHPLAVCMQTGKIHLWDTSIAPLENEIVKGFAVHPAQIAISLNVENTSGMTPADIPTDLNELIIQIRTSPKNLDLIAQHKRIKDLKENIQKIENELKSLKTKPESAEKILFILKELNHNVEKAVEEAKAQFKQGAPEERLQKLLHLKILETLLAGPSQENGVGQYNLAHAAALSEEALELIAFQKECGSISSGNLLIAGKKAACREAYAEWKNFLKETEKLLQKRQINKGEFGRFSDIVSLFAETKSLSSWLTFFPKKETALQTFQNILKENTPDVQTFASDLLAKQQKITLIRGKIDRFADPAAHPAAWRELQTLIEPFQSSDWLQKIQSKPPSVQAAAYQVMEQALDLLDLSLKTLKMSSRFDEFSKATLFKQMLIPYFEMMKSWAVYLVPEKSISHHLDWPLEKYLDQVKNLLKEMNPASPNMLLPSNGFSVSAAILTAGTAFERHEPRTLEDMLTLIHQNSLSWTSILNQNLLSLEKMQNSSLPKIVQQAAASAENGNWGITLQRIGLEVKPGTIVIRYNVPLRNHSGHIDLIYDTHSKEMIFQAQLLGQARERWSKTTIWIDILQKMGVFASQRPIYQNNQELTFSWKVNEENLKDAFREYSAMADYSLRDSFEDAIRGLYDRWEARKESGASMNNFSAAIASAAQQAMSTENQSCVETALYLFTRLFVKGQGFEAAVAAAQLGLSSQNPVSIYGAISLFTNLFKMEQGFEAAAAAAENGINVENREIQKIATGFLSKLVAQGYAHETAITTAQYIVKNGNDDSRYRALKLLHKLVKMGKGYEVALDAVQHILRINDHENKHLALIILDTLIDNKQIYEAAVATAEEAIKSDYELVEKHTSLLTKLAKTVE
jgi:hypothetical protein